MSPRPLSQLRQLPLALRLGARARVRVSGADAARYLEGQLSNRLQGLAAGTALQALLLTAKGKLCARVFVWKEEDAWLLDAEPELADALEARAARYIVADDVIVEPAHTEDAGWHVLGGDAPCSGAVRCRRLGMDGWDAAAAPAGMPEITPSEAEILRVIHGVPAWGRELDEDTLPHEARLELEAVDFRKGCYVGQETVSRLQSVGRPTRRLQGLRGEFPEQTGLGLFDGETRVGVITSATRHFELPGTLALGYVNTRCEASSLAVRDEAGREVGEATIHEFPLA
ncbi:MAG: hypothetical protein N2322_04305 [Terrimicrobiaceae bacterium]|nr:hypothetical protein [Terrimicrobiaceae bacterium]